MVPKRWASAGDAGEFALSVCGESTAVMPSAQLGTFIALPMLEWMVPLRAAEKSTVTPQRSAFIYGILKSISGSL